MKIACFAGSTRKNSFNMAVAKSFAKIATDQGHECIIIDINDHPLPLFNQDDENDILHAEAQKLADKLDACDAIFIASPEYNGSVTPLLKNTIDWMSRLKPTPFAGKIYAIGSASPGGLGGMRGLAHLRDILTSVGAIVIPQMFSVGGISKLLDDDGLVIGEAQQKRVSDIITMIEILKK